MTQTRTPRHDRQLVIIVGKTRDGGRWTALYNGLGAPLFAGPHVLLTFRKPAGTVADANSGTPWRSATDAFCEGFYVTAPSNSDLWRELMPVANVSRSRVDTFPAELQTAQDAIHLPEVQDMLRKLARYSLGIYMPHMHDEATGAFQSLPLGVTQVEDDLEVSFRQEDELTEDDGRSYVPIGWFWRDGAVTGMTCTARCVKMGTDHTSGHVTGGEH